METLLDFIAFVSYMAAYIAVKFLVCMAITFLPVLLTQLFLIGCGFDGGSFVVAIAVPVVLIGATFFYVGNLVD